MPSKSDKPVNLKLANPQKTSTKTSLKAAPRPVPKIEIVADIAADPLESIPLNEPTEKVEALKLKQLVEAVAEKTDAKKKLVRDVIEAALVEMADALSKGHSLSLPGLGNMRVIKTQEKGDAKMMVLRLRVGGNGAKDDLAEDGEDD
jgi:predicted DNA-binding protein (UPF0251 family)